MERNAQHVIPQDGQWAVKGEGKEKATKVFESKMAAIAHAYDIAKKNAAYLVVHKETGEISRFKTTEDTNKLLQMIAH